MSSKKTGSYCCDDEGVVNYFGSGSYGIPATPLMEVCSVIIQGGGDGDSAMQRSILVYGEIFVRDEKGKKYYFYNRPRASPESVSFGKGLSLIDLNKAALSMDAPDLFFRLKVKVDKGKDDIDDDAWYLDKKDGDDDPWFLNERVDLSTMNKDIISEQVGSLTYNTALGTVTHFHYFVMPCAVAGQVKVDVLHPEGFLRQDVAEGDFDFSFHGNIVARYGKTVSALKTCESERDFVLFNKVSKKAKKVRYWETNVVSRSLVCMSSYSSILLDVDICVKKIGGVEKDHIKSVYELIPNVRYNRLHNNGKCKASVAFSLFVDLPDSPSLGYKLLKQSHMSMDASIIPPIPPKVGRHDLRVIIFSVSVGLYSDGGLKVSDKIAICGKVSVLDDNGQRCIFHPDQNHPHTLSSPTCTLPLKGKMVFGGFWVRFTTCIRDAGTGHEISHGFYNLPKMEGFPKVYMNRPLCTVITGEHGYAAVHYGVFPSVVLAVVEFCVTPENSDDKLIVNGMLSARFAGFEYFLSYEKEYYRFVLFEGKGQCKSCEGYALPLSSSVFGVPSWSTLIFEVDFDIKGSNGSARRKEELLFKVGDTKLKDICYSMYEANLNEVVKRSLRFVFHLGSSLFWLL